MNDPERLIERGATPFEARLLRAGRSDTMSDRSRRVIASSLGVGGVLTIGAGIALMQKAGRVWARSGLVRWAGAAALAGGALFAGVLAFQHHVSEVPTAVSVSAPAKVVDAAPVEATPQGETAAPPASEEEAPSPNAPSRARAPRSAASSADNLGDELAAIEAARRALVQHDTAQCLRLLDDYTRRFGKRRLDAEATVLRIEALSQSGERSAALRLGQSFLNRNPQGPYARRVRSLIGVSAP